MVFNMKAIEMKSRIPEGKISFCLLLPKELDREFREFVAEKYGGYHRGILTKEFELAIRNLIDSQGKVRS